MRDNRPLSEDVTGHSMLGYYDHGDGRVCSFHQRLDAWVFFDTSEGWLECLRPDHPSKTRAGDQALPTGDVSIPDDQALLIQDIEERRQVGIERYGQGHRPWNGRHTLHDLYEEQLDLLVYFRSIKRMSEATRGDLVAEVRKVLADMWSPSAGGSDLLHQAFAEKTVDRIMGYVDAKIINSTERS
jgi:hypothetical protein